MSHSRGMQVEERLRLVAQQEALRIVAEGLVDGETVDRILELAGFSVGPIDSIRRVGVEEHLRRAVQLYEAELWDPRYRPLPRLELVERRRDIGGTTYGSRQLELGPICVVGDGHLAESLRAMIRKSTIPTVEAVGEAQLVVVAGLGYLEVRRLGLRKALDSSTPGTPILAHCAPWTVTDCASTFRRTESVAGFAASADLPEARVIEVAGGLNSERAPVDAGLQLFSALGLTAIESGDGPGMVAARVMSVLANEATLLLSACVCTPREIDAAATGGLLAVGPLRWAEDVGLDVVVLTLRALHQEYGEQRYQPAVRLKRLVQAGRTGSTAARGFS